MAVATLRIVTPAQASKACPAMVAPIHRAGLGTSHHVARDRNCWARSTMALSFPILSGRRSGCPALPRADTAAVETVAAWGRTDRR